MTLLELISRDIVEIGRATRSVIDVPPYLGLIDPNSPSAWRSQAVVVASVASVGGPGPVFFAIERLRSRFSDASRQLRFELFDRYLPRHASLLEAAGFLLRSVDPVLTVTRAIFAHSNHEFDRREVVTIIDAFSDDSFRDYVCARRVAFGLRTEVPGREGAPVSDTAAVDLDEEVGAARRDANSGRVRNAAIVASDCVASVAALQGTRRSAELVGVGTIPEMRGRGYATALCSHLIARHFAVGGTLVWLTAGSREAERMYRSLGFRRIGANQYNYDDAPAVTQAEMRHFRRAPE